MLVHPSADFSTADVARGVFGALKRLGVSTAEYKLSTRLQYTEYGLRQLGQELGLGPTPDFEMMIEHASEGLVYRTVIEGCRWVLVIAGMSLHPNALAALRRIGVKIAVVYTESPYTTDDEGELRMIPVTDIAFTNERTSVPTFQKALDAAGMGGQAHYFRHAYEPSIHFPAPSDLVPEMHSDVLFVGTGFPERLALFEGINWDGIDFALGGNWAFLTHYGSPHTLTKHLKWSCLDNRDTVKLYRSAKIIVNPHRWAEGAESANPRVFEAAACGVATICDDRAEVTELFGDSVPTFPMGVPWRMESQIRRLLNDDELRRNLASQALAKVQGQTFDDRAKMIVDAMVEHDRTVGMRAR